MRTVTRRPSAWAAGLLAVLTQSCFASAGQPPPVADHDAACPANSGPGALRQTADSTSAECRPGDLLPPLTPDPAAAPLTSLLGPRAATLETEHFAVLYTAPPAQARDLAQRLETVYHAHVKLVAELRLPVRRPPHKLAVLFFESHAAFAEHLATLTDEPSPALGFYDAVSRRSVFFDFDSYPPLQAIQAAVEQAPAAHRERLRQKLRRRRAALELSVMQHEAAHHIQSAIGLIPTFEDVPIWLAEGLATLYEVPLTPAGQPRESVNGYRLFEYRQLHADHAPSREQLVRLMSDDAAWCGGQCYPLAWALTQYLRDAHGLGLAALLRRAATGAGLPSDPGARRALFDKLLGPIDERWVTQFHDATMKLPLEGTAFAE